MKNTRTDLLLLSKEYFDTYPSVDLFHATEDGLFFLPEQRADAINHSQFIGGAVEDISREDSSVVNDEAPKDEFSTLTKDQISGELKALGVSFDSKLKKDELLKLLKDSLADLIAKKAEQKAPEQTGEIKTDAPTV